MRRNLSEFIPTAGFLLLAYLIFLIFKPFSLPLIFSIVVVILFYPLYAWFESRMPPFWAAMLSTIIVLFIIIVPVLAIATGIVHETIDITQAIQSFSVENIMDKALTQVKKLGLDLDLNEIIINAAQKITGLAGGLASSIIGNAWNAIIGILATLIATFFIFRDGKKALKILQALPLNGAWSDNLIQEIGIMIKANIMASFVAASLQGLVGGLAFAFLGLPAPILWGTVMGFFSIFPYMGSWLIWIPAIIILVMSNRIWEAIILLIVGIALVNPIDNIIRPAIVSSATHVNGLLIFIGLLGGVQAFGLSGLLLGPVLVIISASLLKVSAEGKLNKAKLQL